MLLLAVLADPAGAQLDRTKLIDAFRSWDESINQGKGQSDNPDSGALGWGESAFLRQYSDLWQVTHDPHWLGKIEDHFERILAHARDHDGDGYLGWQTTAFSAGLYYAQALHNVSEATIQPAEFRELDGKIANRITGHTYTLEFLDATRLRIVDQTAHTDLIAEQTYTSGEPIAAIPGCSVAIEGAPRQGDMFMVRTVAPEATEYTVHEGMITYPVAVFVEAVFGDPSLQPRFGAAAERYLRFMNQLLHKHERQWLDTGEGVGAWRFAPLLTDRYPNRIMPHNQYLCLARTFLVLQDLPGADPLMAERVAAMARNYHHHLRERDAAYVWHYWDWLEGGKADCSGFGEDRCEDTSHAAITVGFTVEAARRRLLFTDADMLRYTRTVLDLMWNRSEDNPKLGNSCSTSGNEFPVAFRDWIDLCQWEPRIYQLALTCYLKERSAGAGPMMLLAEERCRK